MSHYFPELGLERVLAALTQELLAASDEELAQVAGEIGLKPEMQGSVALFGVTSTLDVAKLAARMEKRAARARAAPRPRRGAKDEPPN
jgi:hypothetical protein